MKNDVFVIKDGVLRSYNGNEKDVVIPSGVARISDGAFAGCASLTSVEYTDTMAEWECLVGKANVPASEVKCTDGVWKQS